MIKEEIYTESSIVFSGDCISMGSVEKYIYIGHHDFLEFIHVDFQAFQATE
jgi:hypothetical protein